MKQQNRLSCRIDRCGGREARVAYAATSTGAKLAKGTERPRGEPPIVAAIPMERRQRMRPAESPSLADAALVPVRLARGTAAFAVWGRSASPLESAFAV